MPFSTTATRVSLGVTFTSISAVISFLRLPSMSLLQCPRALIRLRFRTTANPQPPYNCHLYCKQSVQLCLEYHSHRLCRAAHPFANTILGQTPKVVQNSLL